MSNTSEDRYTLCIVKPDAFGNASQIEEMLLKEGFKVVLAKTLMLRPAVAAWFYQEHKGKDFFQGNVDFMCSGYVQIYILHRESQAVSKLRELLGATDPAKAAEGTIRRLYGSDLPRNAAHGSDSRESFLKEAQFMFAGHRLIEVGVDL